MAPRRHQPPPPFTTVFDGEHLRAYLSPGTRPLLIVTFDYRQPTRAGFSAPNASSGFARQGYGQLNITSRLNDWFVNPDTPALERALPAIVAPYAARHALGYSMGGFGALRFARALALDHVVLISPQATLNPALAPWEGRYAAEARGFDPDLGRLPPCPGLGGVLALDPFVAPDLAHARLIQRDFPGLRLARMNFAGHPAINALRAAQTTWVVQRETAAPAGPATLTAAHRAARGVSPGYWSRLSQRAGTRRPDLAALALARARDLPPAKGESLPPLGDSG